MSLHTRRLVCLRHQMSPSPAPLLPLPRPVPSLAARAELARPEGHTIKEDFVLPVGKSLKASMGLFWYKTFPKGGMSFSCCTKGSFQNFWLGVLM